MLLNNHIAEGVKNVINKFVATAGDCSVFGVRCDILLLIKSRWPRAQPKSLKFKNRSLTTTINWTNLVLACGWSTDQLFNFQNSLIGSGSFWELQVAICLIWFQIINVSFLATIFVLFHCQIVLIWCTRIITKKVLFIRSRRGLFHPFRTNHPWLFIFFCWIKFQYKTPSTNLRSSADSAVSLIHSFDAKNWQKQFADC